MSKTAKGVAVTKMHVKTSSSAHDAADLHVAYAPNNDGDDQWPALRARSPSEGNTAATCAGTKKQFSTAMQIWGRRLGQEGSRVR